MNCRCFAALFAVVGGLFFSLSHATMSEPAAPDTHATPSAATAPGAPAKPRAPTHVYLLKGFMGVFSYGLDPLSEKIKRRGMVATVHSHTDWSSLVDEAVRECRSGRTIILIGHSFGGEAVVAMAERLGKEGVPVPLVVTLDPVGASSVSGNVRRLLNIYSSAAMGSALAGDGKFHGSLQNVDMKNDADIGHVSITTSAAIHQRILGAVSAAAGSGCRVASAQTASQGARPAAAPARAAPSR